MQPCDVKVTELTLENDGAQIPIRCIQLEKWVDRFPGDADLIAQLARDEDAMLPGTCGCHEGQTGIIYLLIRMDEQWCAMECCIGGLRQCIANMVGISYRMVASLGSRSFGPRFPSPEWTLH